MKKKLNKILLIDDSKADNFIHSRVIRKAEVTDEIIVKYGAKQALDYLTTSIEGEYPNPEMIFLDINMPGMTGWDFLQEYNKLEDDQKRGVIVCMLTTSYAEKDKKIAEKFNAIRDYSNKPLTQEKLMGLVKKHHPELVEEG